MSGVIKKLEGDPVDVLEVLLRQARSLTNALQEWDDGWRLPMNDLNNSLAVISELLGQAMDAYKQLIKEGPFPSRD